MYYVLFHWTKGKMERDFKKFRSEKEVIDFLHEKYKEISVYTIVEPAKEYKFGLYETGAYIKSTLEQTTEEAVVSLKKAMPEPDEEKPADYLGSLKIPEEAILEKTEKTGPERTKAALDKASKLLKRETDKWKDIKSKWGTCIVCHKTKVAPWNKKKICSKCQTKKKTTRPYKSRKET